MNTTAMVSGAGVIGTLIIGVYVWVGKHISNSRKHPPSDKVVFKDVCEAREKTNEAAHEYLGEKIETAIKRSDEQHQELKTDMRAGFTEIKTLIKNGHG